MYTIYLLHETKFIVTYTPIIKMLREIRQVI